MRREGFVQADGAQIHFCAIGQGNQLFSFMAMVRIIKYSASRLYILR